MTTYRLFGATSGSATPQSFAGNFISGMVFTVTKGGMWFQGYWWWVCPTGQSTSPVKCALWSVKDGSGNGVVISGTVVTSGALTAGQWNFIPLATPVQIAIGDTLVAAVGCNGNFPDLLNWWAANGPNGLANGPLFGYGPNTNQGGTSYFNGGGGNPWTVPQGCFSTGGSDPSLVMPFSISGTDNFCVDVQVSDTAPAGYSGSYRLWPNMAAADNMTNGDSAVPYIYGVEIDLSQACTLNKVWFYSGSGSFSLPTSADVWSVNAGGVTGTNAATNAAPAWKLPNGSAAAAGGGWVYTAMPATTLPAGKYRVSAYDSNGASGTGGSKRLGYWGLEGTENAQAVTGANGITNGPMTAPIPANAATCYDFQTNSPGTPTPTFTDPGQSVFQVGPPNSYPNLYVGPSSPGGALFQNYWVDMEVTPVPVTASGGAALLVPA